MKIVIAAGALTFAGIAPGHAQAQEPPAASQESVIVVTGEFREDWQEGSEVEAKGLKNLEKARAELIKASAGVVSAQNRSGSSNARAENAAAEFRRLVAQPMELADAETARDWAKDVEAAAAEWARYDRRGRKAPDRMDKALKQQAKAREDVAEAEAMVERGRAMKAEAERRSLLASNN